jgi:hypothetical protein
LSNSAVSIGELDTILRDGGNSDDSTLRIAAFFEKGKSVEYNTDFLKREFVTQYGRVEESGKGFAFTEVSPVHNVCAWFDERGISLAIGTTALNNIHKVTIPWDVAAGRIENLFNTGQYVTPEMLADALNNEHHELAGRLWNFYRDDMDFLPEEWDSEKGGYPEDEALIKSLIEDKDSRQAIIDRLESDVIQFSYDSNKSRWHDPVQLLADMNDLTISPKSVPNAEIILKTFKYFITQDEIDAQLTHGSSISEGKYRVLSFFLNNSAEYERVKFLKDEYGTGGGTHNAINGWSDHSPGNGITLKRGNIMEPAAKINIKWPAVARRIDTLIKDGRYMTRAELDGIESYEKIILARSVKDFYYDLPEEEYPQPFAKGLDFHYPHEEEWDAINEFLYYGAEFENTLEQMEYIFSNTATDDRYFDLRKEGFEGLTMFRDGEYTLFPGIENLPSPETAAERKIELPSNDNEVVIALDDYQPSNNFNKPQVPIVQLSIFDAMPQLPSVDEQRQRIDQSLREEAAEVQAASTVLENDIDAFLFVTSNENKARLYEQFADNPRSRAAANLVKEIYGDTLPFSLPQAIKRITELVELGLLDGIGDPYDLFDRVREELSDRGYTVAGNFVEDSINAFRAQVGYGEYTDVADYIVNNFQTENSERLTQLHFQPVGSFYEVIGDEARIAADALNLTLTPRNGEDLVGFPKHLLAENARKLTEAGYTAIVETAREAQAETPLEITPPPDFDTVAQTVYDRIISETNLNFHIGIADSRGALRRPVNDAIDLIIAKMREEEPSVYGDYFDDDTTDKLFDHVYRTAWDKRPQPEQPQQSPEIAAEQELVDAVDPEQFLRDHIIVGGINNSAIEPILESIPPQPTPPAQNFRITDEHLGEGGAKAKFRANIDAIRTLHNIETEKRNATPEEQEILSRYVGWGGLQQAFKTDDVAWAKEHSELRELEVGYIITPREYEDMRASTLTAFYTPPTVITAMWDTVQRMGFNKGNILEPSMGIGNFYGLIPQNLWQSKLYGVEIDGVTARIAKQLYPNANIQQTGFEKTEFSDAFFDLVLGNVPFGDFQVSDNRYRQGFSIHDYFFQKSLDKVRPGGNTDNR